MILFKIYLYFLVGDSAGGNLATAVALKLRDTKHTPQVKAQILIYPVLQPLSTDGPSFQADQDVLNKRYQGPKFWLYYAQGHIKHHGAMLANNHTSASFKASIPTVYFNFDSLPSEFLSRDYKRSPTNYGDEKVWAELREVFLNPYFAPLVANNLAGLPPTYIYTAHCDILRDEGVLYAQKLKAAGVQVKHNHSKSGFHAVISIGDSDEIENIIQDIAEFFRHIV